MRMDSVGTAVAVAGMVRAAVRTAALSAAAVLRFFMLEQFSKIAIKRTMW